MLNTQKNNNTMNEEYEDYLENAIELAEAKFDIPKEEIHYNNEHFLQCYEEGTDIEQAVFLLANF